MLLTLTFRGALPPNQRGRRKTAAIMALRRSFAPQVRRQLEARMGPSFHLHPVNRETRRPFVAPVNRLLGSAAELDVLLLTPSQFRAGDIDNRMKTLIDGLTIPTMGSPTETEELEDAEGEPFYCLLEDDSLVTRLSIDARTWFEPDVALNDAQVVVTARIVAGPDVGMRSPVTNLLLFA